MAVLKSLAALAMGLSISSTVVAATNAQCVSEAEGAAIMAAMMPDMINGLRDKCRAHLPPNAYLLQNGNALIARYKVLSDQRWPTAKHAFGRLSGEPEMADKLPDEFFRPMLGSMIGAELVKDVKPEDCVGANRIVENLAPLPAENVASLIGAILVLAGKDGGKDGFEICKA